MVAEEKIEQAIFFVEDDVDLAEMLTSYFRVQGYQVDSSPWGEDAVDLMTASPPDIAVLDIHLPDIDGYEVCRRLRHNRRTQDLPVIFLTERREREDRLAGLELGAVDYITKPFDVQELRLRVRNALRRNQRDTLVNPITGLPEGRQLKALLQEVLSRPDWGLILAEVHGLPDFRDKYGFVAADDVTRAVALMLSNARQETGQGEDFVGHLDTASFLLVTGAAGCADLAQRSRRRLRASIPFFYPALERQRAQQMDPAERLQVRVAHLTAADHDYTDLASLLEALDTA